MRHRFWNPRKRKGCEPILWFRCGPSNYAVIIKDHVKAEQKAEIESFFIYLCSSQFLMLIGHHCKFLYLYSYGHFLVSNHKFWLLGLVNLKGKRGLSISNKNLLELVQKVVLTHHVDSNSSKPPPEVQKVLQKITTKQFISGGETFKSIIFIMCHDQNVHLTMHLCFLIT